MVSRSYIYIFIFNNNNLRIRGNEFEKDKLNGDRGGVGGRRGKRK